MTIRYRSNLWAGIIAIALGIAILILIPQQIGIDPPSTSTTGITSRTVPSAMAVVMIACGAGLIFQSLVLKKDTVKTVVLKKELRAVIYAVMLIIFTKIFKESYVLATLFLSIGTLVILKCKKPLYYIIEIILIFVLFFIFTEMLHVRLPAIWL